MKNTYKKILITLSIGEIGEGASIEIERTSDGKTKIFSDSATKEQIDATVEYLNKIKQV